MTKNQRIRQHLSETAQERITKNCFRYGNIEIKIDHDSPQKGVEFPEVITVSIYNPKTGDEAVFCVKIADLDFI